MRCSAAPPPDPGYEQPRFPKQPCMTLEGALAPAARQLVILGDVAVHPTLPYSLGAGSKRRHAPWAGMPSHSGSAARPSQGITPSMGPAAMHYSNPAACTRLDALIYTSAHDPKPS